MRNNLAPLYAAGFILWLTTSSLTSSANDQRLRTVTPVPLKSATKKDQAPSSPRLNSVLAAAAKMPVDVRSASWRNKSRQLERAENKQAQAEEEIDIGQGEPSVLYDDTAIPQGHQFFSHSLDPPTDWRHGTCESGCGHAGLGCRCKKHGNSAWGGGIHYMVPNWDGNPGLRMGSVGLVSAAVFIGGDGIIADAGSNPTTAFDDSLNYEVAPYLWAKWECGKCLDVRAEYWGFDTSSRAIFDVDFEFEEIADNEPSDDINLGFAVALASELEMHVFTLEAVHKIPVCCWIFGVGGGIRYAHLDQSYRFALPFFFQRDDAGDITTVNGTLQITDAFEFQAAGPTFLIEAHRPVAHCFAFYGKIRGTVLVGQNERQASAFFDLDITDDGDDTFVDATVVERSTDDQTIGVMDLEFGLHFSKPHKCKTFVADVGAVTQFWYGAGSSEALDELITGSILSLGSRGDLTLFGIRLSAGVLF